MNESMKQKLYALSQIALIGTLVFQVAYADTASDAAQAASQAAQSVKAALPSADLGSSDKGASLAAAIVQAAAAQDAQAAAQKAIQEAATSRFEQALATKQVEWSPLPENDKRTLGWKEVKSSIGLKPEMIAVGANSLWAIEKGRIYRHVKNEWKPCGLGVFVAVGADGTVVSINDKNEVFIHQGGDTWLQVKDVELTQVSVQDAKNMVGLLTNKDGSAKVMECVNGEWSEALNMLKNPAGGLKDVDVNKTGFALGITPNGTPVALSRETKAFLEEHSEEVVTRVTKVKKHRKGLKAGHKELKAGHKGSTLKSGGLKARHGKGKGLKARMNAIKKQNKKVERKLAKAKSAAATVAVPTAGAADHDDAEHHDEVVADTGK